MNQRFERILKFPRILKFFILSEYVLWMMYSYNELLKVQQIWICNLQPTTVMVAMVIRKSVDIKIWSTTGQFRDLCFEVTQKAVSNISISYVFMVWILGEINNFTQ